MALNYTKPNAALLRELRAVASHAEELQRVLKTANVLPEDFPIPEINLLTKTLIGLPKGTAEGCREILDYGRVRLADIGQTHIKPEDDEAHSRADDDALPLLARGMAVDQAIGQLVLSISYAQAEYSRQSGEKTNDDSDIEFGVEPGPLSRELADLRGQIQTVKDELDEFGRHIRDTTLETSERAEQLGRQTQDASGHAGIARNELNQPKPKPARLERIQQVLGRLPDAIEKTGKGMRVGIDIAHPFADQWFNKLPTDIFNLVVKHLRLVAENIKKAGELLKKFLEPAPLLLDGLLQDYGTLETDPNRAHEIMYLYMPKPGNGRHKAAWVWIEALKEEGLIISKQPWQINAKVAKEKVGQSHPGLFLDDPLAFEVHRLNWGTLSEKIDDLKIDVDDFRQKIQKGVKRR